MLAELEVLSGFITAEPNFNRIRFVDVNVDADAEWKHQKLIANIAKESEKKWLIISSKKAERMAVCNRNSPGCELGIQDVKIK